MPTSDQPSLLARIRALIIKPTETEALAASNVSCRDCLHFADVDEPRCYNMWNTRQAIDGWPTKYQRANGGDCGPTARWFKPVAAHA